MTTFRLRDTILHNPNKKFVPVGTQRLQFKDCVTLKNKSKINGMKYQNDTIFMILQHHPNVDSIMIILPSNETVTILKKYIVTIAKYSEVEKDINTTIKFANNHEDFEYLFDRREETGDFIFMLGENKIMVHKFLLIARSKFFRSIIPHGIEASNNVINLNSDIFTSHSLYFLLSYLYLQKIPDLMDLSEDQLCQLIKMMDFCLLPKICQRITDIFFIKITDILDQSCISEELINKESQELLNREKRLTTSRETYEIEKSNLATLLNSDLSLNPKLSQVDSKLDEEESESSEYDEEESESSEYNEEESNLNERTTIQEELRLKIIKSSQLYDERKAQLANLIKIKDLLMVKLRKFLRSFYYSYKINQDTEQITQLVSIMIPEKLSPSIVNILLHESPIEISEALINLMTEKLLKIQSNQI